MKTIVKILPIALAAVSLPSAYATPPAPPYLYTQSIGGLWPTPGVPLNFNFTGLTITNLLPASNLVLHVACDETDLYVTPAFTVSNGNWAIAGSLIAAGSNLQVAVTFTSDDPSNAFGGTAFVLPNFNAATNTLYPYQTGSGFTASLASQNLTSPNLPLYDPYGAALNATNGWPWRTYRSAAWSLSALTNGMNDGDFKIASSNGQALVGIWLTNGVPVLKQLMP